jgi:nucleotide-binding universal stress UspA family protein
MGEAQGGFDDVPRPGSTIVVGIDGRDGSRRVLEAAGRLSQSLGLPLVVALVQQYCAAVVPAGAEAKLELQHEIEEAVFFLAAEILDPMKVSWQFAMPRGGPARALTELAESCDAALVVIGTRGDGPLSRLRRLVNGSVSSRLVHGQHRPVLVVPPQQPGHARLTRPSSPATPD